MSTAPNFRGARLAATGALALGALLAACAEQADVRITAPTAANAAFMERYVALGNSITAGYQSGGISDSTQFLSYARILAGAAGVRYSYAGLTGTTCAPYGDAINAFLSATGQPTSRPAATGVGCLRTPASAGAELLTNVAVPGANSADPTGAAGSGANALTSLILGGRTQVERALELDPTFVSIWIGNNDVLGAALRGDTTAATPVATFTTRYDAMLTQLEAPTRKGVLIGVVDPTNAPALFPAAAIVNNLGGFRTAIEQGFLGGRPLQIITATCPANTGALVSMAWLLQAASTARTLPAGQPIPFACAPVTIPNVGTFGTTGIVDEAERAMLTARVTAFNTAIAQRAQTAGWAYWNPNALLDTLRAAGQIAPVPVLAGAQAATAPFGTALSFDGIHPSSATHRRIAASLTTTINQKYQSSIPVLQ